MLQDGGHWERSSWDGHLWGASLADPYTASEVISEDVSHHLNIALLLGHHQDLVEYSLLPLDSQMGDSIGWMVRKVRRETLGWKTLHVGWRLGGFGAVLLWFCLA